jgi:hypothetical protein
MGNRHAMSMGVVVGASGYVGSNLVPFLATRGLAPKRAPSFAMAPWRSPRCGPALSSDPGSVAFEVIRDLVFQLPVMVTPRWVASRSHPIALRDVRECPAQWPSFNEAEAPRHAGWTGRASGTVAIHVRTQRLLNRAPEGTLQALKKAGESLSVSSGHTAVRRRVPAPGEPMSELQFATVRVSFKKGRADPRLLRTPRSRARQERLGAGSDGDRRLAPTPPSPQPTACSITASMGTAGPASTTAAAAPTYRCEPKVHAI